MMAQGDVDGNGLVDDGDGLGDVTIPIIKFGQLIWLLCTYCKYLPKPKTANLAKSCADMCCHYQFFIQSPPKTGIVRHPIGYKNLFQFHWEKIP